MAPQRKEEPHRMCLGCNQKRPKRQLVRVVREQTGTVSLDPSGKAKGRGAYLCPDSHCLAKAISGKRLQRALRTEVPPELVEELTLIFAGEKQSCK